MKKKSLQKLNCNIVRDHCKASAIFLKANILNIYPNLENETGFRTFFLIDQLITFFVVFQLHLFPSPLVKYSSLLFFVGATRPEFVDISY